MFEGPRKCFRSKRKCLRNGETSLAFYASPNQLNFARTKEVGKSKKNSLNSGNSSDVSGERCSQKWAETILDYRYICNRPLNPLTVRIVIINHCYTCNHPFNPLTVRIVIINHCYTCNHPFNLLTVRIVIINHCYTCNRPFNPLTVRIVILNYCYICNRPSIHWQSELLLSITVTFVTAPQSIDSTNCYSQLLLHL